MATAYLRAESAPAYTLPFPPRAAIEAAVETLLGVLDALDGDPDVEDNGDERDVGVAIWGNRDPAYRADLRDADYALTTSEDAEDDDPSEDNGDERDDDGDTRDASFPEQLWQVGEHCRMTPAGWRWERGVELPRGAPLDEDSEEDDEPEDGDQDGEHDGREVEEGEHVMHTGVDQTKAISDTNPALM